MKTIIAILLALLISTSAVMAAVTIKLRGDTAANWTSNNPVLALREPGVETDTNKLKIGDGVTAWNTLPYVAGESGEPVDLTAPGPIGSVTPNTGNFTALVAATYDVSPPATGETGEIGLPEDPANGSDRVTLKAPADVTGDLVFTLPSVDGSAGECLSTNGAGVLSWVACGGQ